MSIVKSWNKEYEAKVTIAGNLIIGKEYDRTMTRTERPPEAEAQYQAWKKECLQKIRRQKENGTEVTPELVASFYDLVDRETYEALFDMCPSDWESEKEQMIIKTTPRKKEGEIRADNISRSRQKITGLAYANMPKWKTFITLTFAENETDITKAYKKLRSWAMKMQYKYSDFMALVVPEYQKRGAIHYHMLTTLEIGKHIEYDPHDLKKKTASGKYETVHADSWKVPYWDAERGLGFSHALDLTGEYNKHLTETFDPALYMVKYLVKDMDKRFYGRHKYYTFGELEKPETLFVASREEYQANLDSLKGSCGYIASKDHFVYVSEKQYIPSYIQTTLHNVKQEDINILRKIAQ